MIELIKRIIKPETDLELRIISDYRFIEGDLWGKPRNGHPEGMVINHIEEAISQPLVVRLVLIDQGHGIAHPAAEALPVFQRLALGILQIVPPFKNGLCGFGELLAGDASGHGYLVGGILLRFFSGRNLGTGDAQGVDCRERPGASALSTRLHAGL